MFKVLISRLWLWFIGLISSIGDQAVRALMTTVALSVGYMVFNDFIAPVPDMTGSWKFTVVYVNTSNSRFQDLQVTYGVLMTQDGFNLSGHGEKLSDRGPGQVDVNYSGERRTNIEITGRITRRYFSRDVLVLRYKEVGERRESSTIQRVVLCSHDAMGGCFLTTIADTSGPVRWQRLVSREDRYEPVTQLEACDGAFDCSDAIGVSP